MRYSPSSGRRADSAAAAARKSVSRGSRRALERVYRRIGSSIIGSLSRRTVSTSRAGAAATASRSTSRHRRPSAARDAAGLDWRTRTRHKKTRTRSTQRSRSAHRQTWVREVSCDSESEEEDVDRRRTPCRTPDESDGGPATASTASSATALDHDDRLAVLSKINSHRTSDGYCRQLVCSLILSLGSLNVGFSLAFHALADLLPTPVSSQLWVQNLFNVGGLFGGVLSALALAKGRKRPLMMVVLLLAASWLFVIFADGKKSLIFGGRVTAGMSAGLIAVLTQVYISELASAQHRGGLGILPTVAGLAGTLLCLGASYAASWADMAVTGAALTAPYLLLLASYVPESPRHLLRRGSVQAAIASLQKVRGGQWDVTPELHAIEDAVALQPAGRRLLQRSFLMPVTIASGLMFFSQFGGIDGVLMYAFRRFNDRTAASSFHNFPVVILYSVQLCAALICLACVDRSGRKLFLLLSTAISAVSLLVLGAFILLEDLRWLSLEQYGLKWVLVTCVILYTGAFALGLGPLPWLMLGELLPAHDRGVAASVIATFFWGSSLIITTSFGDMQNAMYLSGTFWFYTIFCVFGYLFVLLVVPDVRQASLEDIQLFFANNNVRLQDRWNLNVP